MLLEAWRDFEQAVADAAGRPATGAPFLVVGTCGLARRHMFNKGFGDQAVQYSRMHRWPLDGCLCLGNECGNIHDGSRALSPIRQGLSVRAMKRAFYPRNLEVASLNGKGVKHLHILQKDLCLRLCATSSYGRVMKCGQDAETF